MTTNLAMWGTSLGVRIPKQEAERAGFSSGEAVEVFADGQQVVIKKANRRYSLDELVSKITAKNLHSEIDTDPSVGNEYW